MSKSFTRDIMSITKIPKDLLPLILEYYYDREEVKKRYKKVMIEYHNNTMEEDDEFPYMCIGWGNWLSYDLTYRNLDTQIPDQNYIISFRSEYEKRPLSHNYYHQQFFP